MAGCTVISHNLHHVRVFLRPAVDITMPAADMTWGSVCVANWISSLLFCATHEESHRLETVYEAWLYVQWLNKINQTYLFQVRHKLSSSETEAGAVGGARVKTDKFSTGSSCPKSRNEKLQIIDTTLLKCYVQVRCMKLLVPAGSWKGFCFLIVLSLVVLCLFWFFWGFLAIKPIM